MALKMGYEDDKISRKKTASVFASLAFLLEI